MLAHLGELALGDADRRALVALGGAAARRIRRRWATAVLAVILTRHPPVVLLAARRPALHRGRHAVRLVLARLDELALGGADRRALVALGGAAARRIRRRQD